MFVCEFKIARQSFFYEFFRINNLFQELLTNPLSNKSMNNCHLKKVTVFIACLILSLPMLVLAAPEAVLDSYWNISDEKNKNSISHEQWQVLLDTYLVKNDSASQNLFSYKKVSEQDKQALKNYLEFLQAKDPGVYSLSEQKAYWINLYNALTVNLILENYPVDSITDIKQRFYRFGPWDDKIARVQGKPLSLNDIEHRIIRPVWKDPRIHYGVNCASIGCPNLPLKVFTGKNVDNLLEQAAEEFINHDRGVSFKEKQLTLSKLYSWYQVDFGEGEAGVIKHLMKYAKPKLKEQLKDQLKEQLKNYQGSIRYEYDWRLNESL